MLKTIQQIFSVLIAGALIGCTTPYQDIGMMGGVEQTKLASDTYMIRVQINSLTPRAKLADYALLRASELALADGYPYFIITNSEDLTAYSSVPLPSYSQTNGSAFGTAAGGSAVVAGSSTTTTMPSMDLNTSIPEMRVYIKMYKAKPKINGVIFDAATIKASLAPKYINNVQHP